MLKLIGEARTGMMVVRETVLTTDIHAGARLKIFTHDLENQDEPTLMPSWVDLTKISGVNLLHPETRNGQAKAICCFVFDLNVIDTRPIVGSNLKDNLIRITMNAEATDGRIAIRYTVVNVKLRATVKAVPRDG